MKLVDLLTMIPFYKHNGNHSKLEEIYVNDLTIDHRLVEKGDVFICLRGFTTDSHKFAKQAEKNGAIAIISERNVQVTVPTIIVSNTHHVLAKLASFFYEFPSYKLPMFGVTGTNGKTTITYLLETIFRSDQQKTGIIGTIQTKIGNKTYKNAHTTPDALSIQKTLAKMVEENVDALFMEVSSHALDLGRVQGCDYDVVIFTNFSQDHLDFHQSMDDYLRAKTLLFAQQGNTYNVRCKKYAIINQDDPASYWIKKSTSQHIVTYGCNHKADVMAKNIKTSIFKTNFTLATPVGSVEITTPLIGTFNVYNLLAAASASIVKGIPLTCIRRAFQQIKQIHGRFERLEAPQPFTVIIDYAHTPDALKNALETIQVITKGNVYVVIGCGGDRDRSKRPEMAKVALTYADRAIFTSDNPRTENPYVILQDMIRGITASHYEIYVDRKEAIFRAIELAKPEDVVLIAGKGHETYQQIGRIKYNFDDRKVAKEAMHMKEN